ncbi:MAG: TRAP transporter small permease [Pseudomonadota bacterium]
MNDSPPLSLRIYRSAESLSRGLAWVGGAALIVMAFVITAEALLRRFGGPLIGGVDEYTAYVFAITMTWGFAYTAISRGNVRIDFIYDLFPPGIRIALDVLAWASMLFFFAIVAYFAADLAWSAFQGGDRARTPLRTLLWVPQGLWALGFVVLVLALLAMGARALVLLRRGERDAARQIIGTGGHGEGDALPQGDPAR